jgi:hypothetical protein
MIFSPHHGRALSKRRVLSSKEVILQRRIFSLLFLIAGVLLFQSVQAQPFMPVDADGTNKAAPTGTFDVSLPNSSDALFAHNGGTIGGTGDLTLKVTGDGEFKVLHALGGSITMDTGQTVIDMTQLGPANANARGAHADGGGTVILKDFIISELPSPGSPKGRTRGVEAGNAGSSLSATDTKINMGPRAVGAYAYSGAKLDLTNCVITITDSTGALGWGTSAQNAGLSGTTLTATDTTVSVTGDNKSGVSSYFGGATTILDHCTVIASGTNTDALDIYNGEIDVTNNSTVTGTLAAFVGDGGVLDVRGNSTIHGDVNGILITDDDNPFGLPPFGPDKVALTNSKLTNRMGVRFQGGGSGCEYLCHGFNR